MSSYAKERSVAIAAVLRACTVAQAVFDQLVKGETATKSDDSPVTGALLPLCRLANNRDELTVADYAAQALVSTLLFAHFPQYGLVGEEDSSDLRSEGQKTLRDKVVELANHALQHKSASNEDDADWNVIGSPTRSADDWLAAIDKGNASETAKGRA